MLLKNGSNYPDWLPNRRLIAGRSHAGGKLFAGTVAGQDTAVSIARPECLRTARTRAKNDLPRAIEDDARMTSKNTASPPKTLRTLIAAGSAAQKLAPLPTGCVRPSNATRARTNADVLDLLADAMAARIARVPVDGELWGVEECAQHLKIEPAAVQRLRNRTDFPEARRLGSVPLWVASEVIAWAKGRTLAKRRDV